MGAEIIWAPANRDRARHLSPLSPAGALRCRRKFVRYFPGAFHDDTYLDWERGYKWKAHERWNEWLNPGELRALMRAGEHQEIARRAVAVESRTNLLFSFEKMALRDALRTPAGARHFAAGLADWVYGKGDVQRRFERWVGALAHLPRRQRRVVTWPVLTVFGFLAKPDEHIFLKPNVTRRAARAYGFGFEYASRPNWRTYDSLLAFARRIQRDQADLRPRDLIDLQSFIWVLGSEEYP